MLYVVPEGCTPTRRVYQALGRNGYYGVDEFANGQMQGNVDAYKTRKQADGVANHMGRAYADGFRDAHIGLTLPLIQAVRYTKDVPDGEVNIPAGTLVKVLSRNHAAWYQCEVVGTGLTFECQFSALREWIDA